MADDYQLIAQKRKNDEAKSGVTAKASSSVSDYINSSPNIGNAVSSYLQTRYSGNYNNNNNNYSSGSAGGSGGTTTSYNAILEAYRNQLAQSRDAYIAEIESRLNANKQTYENQMEQAKQQYQTNRNTSEVNRYKAKRAVRESLANRGQLDSGYGRQEALDMNLTYDNALNDINNQETSTLNQIKNYIAQLEADAKKEKASAEQNYSSALLSLANL